VRERPIWEHEIAQGEYHTLSIKPKQNVYAPQYQTKSNNIKQYQTISSNIKPYQTISNNIKQHQAISNNITPKLNM
jgi:hypothetical protein